MTVLYEGKRAGEFLVSEANCGGTGVARGRTQAVLLAGEIVDVGQFLADDGTGKMKAYVDGDVVAGIAFDAVDATGADKAIVVISSDAEVNSKEILVFEGATPTAINTAITSLALLRITVREAL